MRRILLPVFLVIILSLPLTMIASAQERPRTAPARGDTSSFWMSEEESNERLDEYWKMLRDEWNAEVPEPLNEFGLEPAAVDSLRTLGEVKLDQLVAGTLWRSDLQWLVIPDFNRAQGLVPGVGWTLRKVGPNRPVFRIQGGYAFADERPVGSAQLEWPLLKRRWQLSDGRGPGREYALLTLALGARQDAIRFAGDGRRLSRSLSALLYGADPNHYFDERRVRARLSAQITRSSTAWLSASVAREKPMDQEVRWNVLGRDPSPDGIRRAEGLDARRVAGGAEMRWGLLQLSGSAAWWRAQDADFADRLAGVDGVAPGSGEVDYLRWAVDARIEAFDPLGNEWRIRAQHHQADKPLPRQWRLWAGDYNDGVGMLRGFEAGELSGDIGHFASIDLGLNFDLWKTLRFPVLKKLGMQPLLFADWARTRNAEHLGRGYFDVATPDAVAAELGEGAQDGRANVGFGFVVPGLEPIGKMKLMAARPVGEGMGERDWRVMFVFQK